MEDRHESAPAVIGPYRIEKQLGAGGMGAVYLAHHQRLDRLVALKQIRPDADRDPGRRERFQREARAAARLSHPNIVQVYDILEHDDSDWIVMEYVDGQTLSQMTEAGSLEAEQLLALALGIVRGLAAAHSHGIVHRDLKAENVIVTKDGEAKVLDFGLAKLVGATDSQPLSVKGSVLGTPRAMSPEQAMGDQVDHRSDLFSLGILLYEAATGVSPFVGPKNIAQMLLRICTHEPPSPRELDSRIPQELSALIDRLLRKRPGQRPQSAEEVILALKRISGAPETAVKILFVDDEPDFESLIRQRYRKQIRAEKMLVDFARDGRDALEKLEDEDFALVMTDINMPRMNGLELLERIKQLDRNMLTVIISAYGDWDNINHAMNLGAFGFVTKPIDFKLLEETRKKAVAEILKSREHRHLQEENRLLDERNRWIRFAFSRYLNSDSLAQSLIDSLQDPLEPDQRLDVTVLKLGLEDLEATAQLLSPEEISELLCQFFGAVVDIAFRHSGMVTEFQESSITVVFGFPLPQIDAARRAVDCALALRQATAQLSEGSLGEGSGLKLRMGIDSGESVLRHFGAIDREAPLVGRSVTGAELLESQGQDGQILLSETTFKRCGSAYDVSTESLVVLEGAEGPIRFRELYGVRDSAPAE